LEHLYAANEEPARTIHQNINDFPEEKGEWFGETKNLKIGTNIPV
jgi:hypothetical protein